MNNLIVWIWNLFKTIFVTDLENLKHIEVTLGKYAVLTKSWVIFTWFLVLYHMLEVDCLMVTVYLICFENLKYIQRLHLAHVRM